MNRAMSQAELIEIYMNALLKNPEAMPPLDLDAEAAHLVRALVLNKKRDVPGIEVKDRIWNQILFGLHVTPEGDMPAYIVEGDTISIDPKVIPHRGGIKKPGEPFWNGTKRRARAYYHRAVMLVATIFALLFFSGLLLRTINIPQETDSSAYFEPMLRSNNIRLDPGMMTDLYGEGDTIMLTMSYTLLPEASMDVMPGTQFRDLVP